MKQYFFDEDVKFGRPGTMWGPKASDFDRTGNHEASFVLAAISEASYCARKLGNNADGWFRADIETWSNHLRIMPASLMRHFMTLKERGLIDSLYRVDEDGEEYAYFRLTPTDDETD